MENQNYGLEVTVTPIGAGGLHELDDNVTVQVDKPFHIEIDAIDAGTKLSVPRSSARPSIAMQVISLPSKEVRTSILGQLQKPLQINTVSTQRSSILGNITVEEGEEEDPTDKVLRHFYMYFDLCSAHLFIIMNAIVWIAFVFSWNPMIGTIVNYAWGVFYVGYSIFAGYFCFGAERALLGSIFFTAGSIILSWAFKSKCNCSNVLFWGSFAFLIGSILFTICSACALPSLEDHSVCTASFLISISDWYVWIGYFLFQAGRFYFASSSRDAYESYKVETMIDPRLVSPRSPTITKRKFTFDEDDMEWFGPGAENEI